MNYSITATSENTQLSMTVEAVGLDEALQAFKRELACPADYRITKIKAI